MRLHRERTVGSSCYLAEVQAVTVSKQEPSECLGLLCMRSGGFLPRTRGRLERFLQECWWSSWVAILAEMTLWMTSWWNLPQAPEKTVTRWLVRLWTLVPHYAILRVLLQFVNWQWNAIRTCDLRIKKYDDGSLLKTPSIRWQHNAGILLLQNH